MTFDAALWTHLATDAGIAALVPREQIETGERLQGAPYPGILYSVQRTPVQTMGGTVAFTSDVYVECWGATAESARAVAAAVSSALHRYSGTMGGVSGVDVLLSELTEEQTDSGYIFPDELAHMTSQRYKITSVT